jgi:C-terminal processing protease CtpA/Prc
VTMSDNSIGGVLITSVVANSPAASIGLRSGDRILAVNNQPASNYRDVVRIIAASPANTPVELTLARGAWRGKLTARLSSAASVFSPARQYAPASRPAYVNSTLDQGSFPSDLFDNGSRGAEASYGGGGY